MRQRQVPSGVVGETALRVARQGFAQIGQGAAEMSAIEFQPAGAELRFGGPARSGVPGHDHAVARDGLVVAVDARQGTRPVEHGERGLFAGQSGRRPKAAVARRRHSRAGRGISPCPWPDRARSPTPRAAPPAARASSSRASCQLCPFDRVAARCKRSSGVGAPRVAWPGEAGAVSTARLPASTPSGCAGKST